MSLSSMTGFGQCEVSGSDYRITFEIKTFNSRFLDISVRLSKELASLEVFVRNRVREKVRRGRVEALINLQTSEAGLFQINREAVASYCALAEDLRKEFQIDGNLTLAMLLQLPGVLQARSPSFFQDMQAFQERVREGLMAALDAVATMRREEGDHLERELLDRILGAENLLAEVESFVDASTARYRDRLWQRLEEYTAAAGVNPDRISQEVAIFAERGDISEEIVRLRSHFTQFRALLEAGGEVGKKLDFLLQEMNRETNTILSKSLHQKISESGVLLKAEVEKLREQVQNIE
ncbi:MAG: YicC family protein [Acidobacteria bacterium]|nr:YicC family protein [Acidobacteriota bacterium]